MKFTKAALVASLTMGFALSAPACDKKEDAKKEDAKKDDKKKDGDDKKADDKKKE